MRLTTPQTPVDLYEQGFAETDLPGRRETGRILSELVEKVQDPMVILLDGPWGSGKSYFLQRWVGAHKCDYQGSATTVYLDAFETDFLDEPLVALTLAISNRLEKPDAGFMQNAWSKAKSAVPQLTRTGIRVGVAAVTAGIVTKADEIGDAVAEAVGKDLSAAASEFWKKEEGKRAAMQTFRQALIDLTESGPTGAPQKLVVVVDELDRCRPDYALSLLETIKHFFTVPDVHFVLGTNLRELENSVKVRYGADVDASKYLQKFYHARIPLENKWITREESGDAIRYFDQLVTDMKLDKSSYLDPLRDLVEMANRGNSITLRDVERILTRAVLAPSFANPDNQRDLLLVSALLFFSVVKPEWMPHIQSRRLGEKTLESFLNFNAVSEDARRQIDARDRLRWAMCPLNDPIDLTANQLAGPFTNQLAGPFTGMTDPTALLIGLIETYLDTVQMS
jgi:hypothetical protein